MTRTLTFLAIATAVALAALPAGAAAPPPPGKRIAQLERQVAALKTRVTRLQRDKRELRDWSARSWRRELALRRYAAAPIACPVTRPNGWAPPGSTFGAEFHGNGSLWVGLQPANIVVDERQPDGAVWQKFGWFRRVVGTLTITGRRLDGPAPPLRAEVPDGYGDRDFQSSGIFFPTEGCWEVTGRAGEATLTFVTLVLASEGS